ncbi:hypothetical protein VSU19_19835 [Verrucomicrobiales bacterium BCK34]|nr:hypothetical protein [Verrucomicrobiales bacterium BCK34]
MTFLQAPLDISKRLRDICEEVSPENYPIYMGIEPLPEFPPDNCYFNVAEMVEREGGDSVFGWAIYEWPRVWHEFQFHAIWRDNEGDLHDVTPRRDNEKVVLFLPSELEFTGAPVSTRWFLMTSRSPVKEIRDIQIEIEKLKQDSYAVRGAAPLPVGPERDLIISLEQKKLFLMSQQNCAPKLSDPCPCMSRQKYKFCCGRHTNRRR